MRGKGTLKKSNGIEPPPAPTITRRPRHESAATAVARVAFTPTQSSNVCCTDSAGELANLVCSIRTTRDAVVRSVLDGPALVWLQLRIDGDDSCTGQQAKELDRIDCQAADANYDGGTARRDAGKRRHASIDCSFRDLVAKEAQRFHGTCEHVRLHHVR